MDHPDEFGYEALGSYPGSRDSSALKAQLGVPPLPVQWLVIPVPSVVFRSVSPALENSSDAIAFASEGFANWRRRYCAGGEPNSRLKARLNDASEPYPTAVATPATVSSAVWSISAPSSRRHRVK